MNTDSWIITININNLQKNTPVVVFPKGLQVLLIKINNTIYALSNKCAHMACSLAGGSLEGYIMKCPCHDWRFDIRTGQFLDAPEINLPVYKTKISDENIFVKMVVSNKI